MTVYVDDMHKVPMGQLGRMKMSHMLADTEAELFAMADRIGVARRWYQGDHFDIAMSKRDLAIAAGAVPVSMKQIAAMNYRRRLTGALGDPNDAVEWLQRHAAARRASSMPNATSPISI